MKNISGLTLAVFFFATLIIYSILTPLNYFLGLWVHARPILFFDTTVLIFSFLLFYPLTTAHRKQTYAKRYRRLWKVAFVAVVSVSLVMYVVFSVADVGYENGLLSVAGRNMFNSQVWVYICVILAIASSYIDNHSFFLAPYIVSGIIFGLVLTVTGLAASHFNLSLGVIVQINFMVFLVFFRLFTEFLILNAAFPKIKILNGPLKNYVFNLYDNISVIGNQIGDTVNLNNYQEINHSHAKIIKFGGVYSLSDNDPYCRTLLNTSRLTERILKNRDIITVGSAKLLFLQK